MNVFKVTIAMSRTLHVIETKFQSARVFGLSGNIHFDQGTYLKSGVAQSCSEGDTAAAMDILVHRSADNHAGPMNYVKHQGETPLFLVLFFCTLYHP